MLLVPTAGVDSSWDHLCMYKEAAILAQFLKGVTLAVAHASPESEHDSCLGIFIFNLSCL